MNRFRICRFLVKLGTSVAAIVALAALGGAPARAEAEHTSLAMPALTILFLAQYIAEDMQLWQQEDLDVKILNIAGIGAMNAVISGSADFSFSSGASLTRAMAHGQRLLAIASLNNQPGQFVVLRKDVADAGRFDPQAPLSVRAQLMKGGIFAMDGFNSVADAYLRVVAKAGGVSPDQMTETTMAPADFLAAFGRHAISGFSFGPPWPQQVVHQGMGVILSDGSVGEPSGISPLSSAVLVTRPQFCVDHRTICEKMGHAMLQAVDIIYDRPQDARAVLKKRFGNLDDAVLAASYEAVKKMTPRPPITTAEGLANGDNLNVAAGINQPTDKLASYDELLDNQFVK